MVLADRFGGWPGNYERVPADERERYLSMLGVESEVADLVAGLDPRSDEVHLLHYDADDE